MKPPLRGRVEASRGRPGGQSTPLPAASPLCSLTRSLPCAGSSWSQPGRSNPLGIEQPTPSLPVSGLKAATLGASSSLQVGDTVLAIGSPLGLEGSVTEGIVSALDRTITVAGDNHTSDTLQDAIQTDAAINPGNSGGPLVNSAGQVVGITTANASVSGQSSGSIGVGFAIPIDDAKQVINQLMSGAGGL
jgi:S1-C subfamily serine protease